MRIVGRRQSHSDNAAGFSLLELIIVVGIMGIVSMSFLTMMQNQMRATTAISEKLTQIDLKNRLTATLLDGSVCNAEVTVSALNPNVPYTINTSNLSANLLQLPMIHVNSSLTAPALITVGRSYLDPRMVIKTIAIRNFVDAGIALKYLADLDVEFEPTSLVVPLKPLTSKVVITIDASKKVVSCATSGTASGTCNYTDPNALITMGCAQCMMAGGAMIDGACIYTVCNDPMNCAAKVSLPRELDGRNAFKAKINADALCVTMGYQPFDYSTITHSTSCGSCYGFGNYVGTWEWHDWCGVCGSDVTVLSKVRCKN